MTENRESTHDIGRDILIYSTSPDGSHTIKDSGYVLGTKHYRSPATFKNVYRYLSNDGNIKVYTDGFHLNSHNTHVLVRNPRYHLDRHLAEFIGGKGYSTHEVLYNLPWRGHEICLYVVKNTVMNKVIQGRIVECYRMIHGDTGKEIDEMLVSIDGTSNFVYIPGVSHFFGDQVQETFDRKIAKNMQRHPYCLTE